LMNKATSSFVPVRLPAGTLIAGLAAAPHAEPTLNRSTDAGFERCALHALAARA